jgi:phytanoyl-CoA hydroxylase
LALDDATLENGCLWVRPGSHKEPLRRQFIRNPEYFEKGNTESPKLTFRQHDDNANVTWEGSLPQTSLLEEGFIPIEVKAGDLVTFCGTLDHLSLPNFSNLPRHTFQLHLVEGPKEGIAWSPSNWLQYPPGEPFLRLVHDNDSAAQKPSGGVCDSK